MKSHIQNKYRDRIDYDLIVDLIVDGSRVLDLGCGSGELLKRLEKEKNIRGQGIELLNDKVRDCISKGLSVVQTNINEGLSSYGDKAFDAVILDLILESTLHPLELIKETLRVGKRVFINFPNFGYIKIRSQLFLGGKMPKTKELPCEWYDSPHVHLFTIADFWDLCRKEKIKVVKVFYHNLKKRYRGLSPNLFAQYGLFVLEKS
ncbi:MAG: methionine biosynthesis protein MetW [bacterium]